MSKVSLTLLRQVLLYAHTMGAGLQKIGLPDRNWKAAKKKMPERGTLVKYRTEYYQMLGYIDKTGRWVAMDGQEESLPVQGWREISEPQLAWPEISAQQPGSTSC